jgi:outer membrane lipoprotein-sorting protein
LKRVGIPVHIFLFVLAALLAPDIVRNVRATPRGAQPASLTENQVLSHMDEIAQTVKTVSAHLEYTTVTVLVNDRSTQNGQIFYRKGKRPEVLVKFTAPEPKEILFKKNRAEIYYPKINQIQEYDLERRRDVLQQFLLLGFGTESSKLEQSYRIRYLGEQKLGNEAFPVLELTPIEKDIAAQLSKVELWISPGSWLPVQQQFFEPSGDYLIARYSNMKINRELGPSVFKIHPKPGVERMKMN